MPELPEAEYGRKVAHAVAVGRRIQRARCDDDRIVFANASPRTVSDRLRERTVIDTHRHGKYIWLELDRRPFPLFHFGMTGAFRTRNDRPLRLASSPRALDSTWPPRFTKIHLTFDDGGELVMTNARRLGRIRLLHDPPAEPPLCRLGFDPLLALPRRSAFEAAIRRRTSVLKGLLLDQTFAAGVGNWIADEVLYRARLDPRRRTDTLSDDEVEALRRALRDVVRTAVRVDARKDRFPRTWLFHRRWSRSRADVDAEGHPIERITLAGRSTAWVPARQR